MKPFNSIQRTAVFIVVTFVTLIGHFGNASQGGSSTGGGYKYRDTVYKHVKIAQQDLIGRLEAFNQSELNKIAQQFTEQKIQKQRLIRIIQNIQFAENKYGTRLVDGEVRSLDMDFTLEGEGRIIALQPFIDAFHKVELTKEESRILRRKILHESSHIFGIGNQNDEHSYEFAENLLHNLQGVSFMCGTGDKIEARIASCARRQRIYNYPLVMEYSNFWLNRVHFSFTASTSITDRREEIGYLVAELSQVNMKDRKGAFRTAESVCSQVHDLDGQVIWRPVSAEELNVVLPPKNRSYISHSDVAIRNGQVSYVNRNAFSDDEIRVTEISNTRRIKDPDSLSLFCLGAVQ